MEKKKLTEYKNHVVYEKNNFSGHPLSHDNIIKTAEVMVKKYASVLEHLKNV